MKETIVYGVLDTVVIMFIYIVVLKVFAKPLAGIFALSSEIIHICVSAMRIIAIGYLFASINISFQGIFQAMEKDGYSLVISLIRMVLVALPLAWSFTLYAPNKNLVFFAFPLAELCGAIVALFMYHQQKNYYSL